MQSAIDQQLSKMEQLQANKRVGLIAFNDNVSFVCLFVCLFVFGFCFFNATLPKQG